MHCEDFFDADSTIYKAFENEWLENNMYESFEEHWAAYIKDLNLGIEFKERVCDIYADGELYKIVDEKKWMYTRLKYSV